MEKLPVDSPLAFPSGAGFTAPKGWTAEFQNGTWILEDPEHEITLAVLETAGEDSHAVARESWQVFSPGFSRALHTTEETPTQDGWDEAHRFTYETLPSEKRCVAARLRRQGGTWWVLLVDGALAAADRRGAQINLVSLSLRAPGMQPESFAGKKPKVLDAARQEELDRFVEEARAQSGVPGAAVAVIQDGRVVFEKGFGYRELGGRYPVTPLTLFAVGSVTKQLTTLMMARLVDRGVFKWETPVLDLLPTFRMGDGETAKRLTMRHTVSASTGLPRQDMELFFQTPETSPEEVMGRMAGMKPTTGFGEVFQYSNTMVAAGGFVAAHAAHPAMGLGEAFDLCMREELFVPLGMHDSTLDIRAAFGRPAATPHSETLEGEVRPLPISIESGLLLPERPAGGVWSNLRDMEQVLLMELAGGLAPGGGRYLSEENILKRREPQVRMNDREHYALGLVVGEECGLPMVSHSGGTMGFITQLFFLPEQGLGAVILTNVCSNEACFFYEAVRRRLFEIWFDGKDQAPFDLGVKLREMRKTLKVLAGKVDHKPDAAWVKRLEGEYENKSLGRVRVRETAEGALFEAPGWDGLLGRKVEKDGTEKAVVTTPPNAWTEMILGEADGRMTLAFELPQQRYVFTKSDVVKK